MRDVYLDWSATTPVSPEVLEAMRPYFSQRAGNASSLHRRGQKARAAVDRSRELIASAVHADPSEIFFTSGGTEANNLGVKGAIHALVDGGPCDAAISVIEHPSVIESARQAVHATQGTLRMVEAGRDGSISLGGMKEAVQGGARFAAVMHVNNETGVLQPVEAVGDFLAEKHLGFHMDACQSLGKTPVDMSRIHCSSASFSAHKLCGPMGVGALYLRKGTALRALFHGGHQEKNIRPGTENVAAIVGFGCAVETALGLLESETKRLGALTDRFLKVINEIPGMRVNGSRKMSVPHILNLSFEGVDGVSLAMRLDLEGIAISTGSACTAGSMEPSHVLLGMGFGEVTAREGVRFSFGRFTAEADLNDTGQKIRELVQQLRSESKHPHKTTSDL